MLFIPAICFVPYRQQSFLPIFLLKNDLVMADAGYGTAHNYIYAQEQQADAILRISPKNFCFYDVETEVLFWLIIWAISDMKNVKFIFCR